MIDELTKAVALNEADLEAATSQLAKLEKEVGEDLSELRNSSGTPLRRQRYSPTHRRDRK